MGSKEYQTDRERRDYSKYEYGQMDELVRCPVCWKDWPKNRMSRCQCGCYFDHSPIEENTWKEDFWLEEHYRFLRRQRYSAFDEHMNISLKKYYNEFYTNLTADYIFKSKWGITPKSHE